MPYANNKCADQPAHARSLTSVLVVRCLDSIIPLVFISEISSLYLASLAAQAGLCLTWLQTSNTGFLLTKLILTCFLLDSWQYLECVRFHVTFQAIPVEEDEMSSFVFPSGVDADQLKIEFIRRVFTDQPIVVQNLKAQACRQPPGKFDNSMTKQTKWHVRRAKTQIRPV